MVQRTPLTSVALKSSPQLTTEHDQVDEYETDSDSDITDVDDFLDTDELALLGLHTTNVSRSGRTLRAALRLDL